MELIASSIAAIAAVAVAIIEARAGAQRKQEQEAQEAHNKILAASFELQQKTAEGTVILLKAAHGDNLNGDVEKAIKDIEDAEDSFSRQTNKILAEVV